jgi:hypothetical protein
MFARSLEGLTMNGWIPVAIAAWLLLLGFTWLMAKAGSGRDR